MAGDQALHREPGVKPPPHPRARAYFGPLVVLTPEDVREVRDAMHGRPGDTAAVVRAKCDTALNHHHLTHGRTAR